MRAGRRRDSPDRWFSSALASEGIAGVAIGDMNSDGVFDLVLSNSLDDDVAVLLGVGDGTFETLISSPTGRGISRLALGDLNGDGALDLVAAAPEDSVAVILGTGDGSFGTPTALSTGRSASGVALGFLDGDEHRWRDSES